MSKEFKITRQEARSAINDLLAHKGEEVIKEYRSAINASKTEAEVSRILYKARYLD